MSNMAARCETELLTETENDSADPTEVEKLSKKDLNNILQEKGNRNNNLKSKCDTKDDSKIPLWKSQKCRDNTYKVTVKKYLHTGLIFKPKTVKPKNDRTFNLADTRKTSTKEVEERTFHTTEQIFRDERNGCSSDSSGQNKEKSIPRVESQRSPVSLVKHQILESFCQNTCGAHTGIVFIASPKKLIGKSFGIEGKCSPMRRTKTAPVVGNSILTKKSEKTSASHVKSMVRKSSLKGTIESALNLEKLNLGKPGSSNIRQTQRTCSKERVKPCIKMEIGKDRKPFLKPTFAKTNTITGCLSIASVSKSVMKDGPVEFKCSDHSGLVFKRKRVSKNLAKPFKFDIEAKE